MTGFKVFTLKPVIFGGDKRDRTADLLNAIQALSQLSYTPMSKMYITRLDGKCQALFLLFPHILPKPRRGGLGISIIFIL